MVMILTQLCLKVNKMSEIRTLDAISLIQANLAQQISRYPESSLSPREVISDMKIKGDQEKFFQTVNTKITKAIFDRAEAVGKLNLSNRDKTLDWIKKNNEELSRSVLRSIK